MDDKNRLKREFEAAKKKSAPKPPYVKHAIAAFLVGGAICCFGQFLTNTYAKLGMTPTEAGLLTTVSLVFLGSFLTALGVYDKIGRVAGAGSIVPITGFANSVVSCALEFKSEGAVFGVGAKMFNIAGPVIVFGTVSSWLVGLVYYIYTLVS